VTEDEGRELAESYRPGIYFPVFILTNADGDVISRWTGYTGADRFIQSLDRAISDLTTLDERVARCQTEPNAVDIQFLAKYYYDTQEFVKSRKYYRQLHELNSPTLDLRYQVFTATAEAVWNDQLPFDSLLAAADDLIEHPKANKRHFGKMARIVTKVSRRTGDTDRIKKYLAAGIEASAVLRDDNGRAFHRELLADYALFVLVDTAEALSVKKQALGDGWESDPARYYQYSDWCFRRGVDLDVAETFIRTATDKATGAKFKARHLRLLAEICHALGRTDEAIALGEQAMEQDPSASYFLVKIDAWRTE
jgi:tetratricopeptide (TPR) repeat protein